MEKETWATGWQETLTVRRERCGARTHAQKGWQGGHQPAQLYALHRSTAAEGTVWAAMLMWAMNQSKLMGTSSGLLGTPISLVPCLCLLSQQWDWGVCVCVAFPY